MRSHLVLFLILLTGAFSAEAQKKVRLINSDSAFFESGIRRLIGNVEVEHPGNDGQKSTMIYCDSAVIYPDNQIDAFGHVRITDGDSVTITSRRLIYDGNKRLAKLRDNVVFEKLKKGTLYTDFLDYDRNSNVATYFNKGRLVDSVNELTSVRGYYDANINMASFKQDVFVQTPEYRMYADSLQYNTNTKVIYFRTMTTVIDNEEQRFDYEGGEYDTKSKQSNLGEGLAVNPDYNLEAKTWIFDDVRKIYNLRDDIVLTSLKDNLKVYSDAATYNAATKIVKAYNNAYVAKPTDSGDTLFLAADTLVSIDSDDPAMKRLLAYRNVRMYKSDMQGVADSLEYRVADSVIIFYRNPVLWSNDNQMTGDTIRVLLKDNKIYKMFLDMNSFVASIDTLGQFNQIKGRRMIADFNDNGIQRVTVDGNGESVYYVMDEENPMVLTGVNKIICSNIIIRFHEQQISNMSFLVRPDASFIPPHEIPGREEDLRLPGFIWRRSERPDREDVVQTPK